MIFEVVMSSMVALTISNRLDVTFTLKRATVASERGEHVSQILGDMGYYALKEVEHATKT